MDIQAPAARARKLSKSYPVGEVRVIAVKDVSFDIAAGTLTALFGPSGSGKTPLVNCLAGLEPASAGTAWIGEHEITALTEKQLTRIRRNNVGIAFRHPTLVPALSVEENLRLPMSIAGRSPETDWFKALVDVAELGPFLETPASNLPASLQQRVSVARALLPQPDLVIADEPTGNLASEPARTLLSFIQRCVKDLDATVLLATHNPIAAERASRALVLFDGRIVDDIDSPTAEALAAALVKLNGSR